MSLDLYHSDLHTRSAVVRNLCVSYRLSCLDMSQSMLQIIRVTRPRPRSFSEILFVHYREIVHMHPYAKLQVCGFTRFDDMFEDVPNFTRVT